MPILISGAWPYANGPLHLGHISSLLPGDILARYFRQKGEKVLYVSGSDCNGTPIAIRAKQEGVDPKIIADRYHASFNDCFKQLGFTYDCYTRTDHSHHHQIVQNIFLELYKTGYIYRKTVEQLYCEYDQQFLPDRYVEGICPVCGSDARGDQCDHCSTILDPMDLINRKCKLCGHTPVVKKNEHLYFRLSAFQKQLTQYVDHAEKNKTWRENAIQLTKRYIHEGLQDRAVSRDLPIGVNVPIKEFEDKKIYVWIEAVSGYYSASQLWAKQTGKSTDCYWNENTISYYVHGKDNIPFHTVIWPAILLGIHKPALPTHIVSNEYVTLEKRKLSTSKNWAVWIPDIIKRYHPDSIRYFLTINAPENRDTDFSWREFILSHNSELLGAYGNFVNRTLKFVDKISDFNTIHYELEPTLQEKINRLYKSVGKNIEEAHFKQGLEDIFRFIRESNKYFDDKKPWIQLQTDKKGCISTLGNCLSIIANLAQLLSPFIPFSSREVQKMLDLDNFSWQPIQKEILKPKLIKTLFERIDLVQIQEELDNLYKQEKNE
ncbi:methionine--tRNA ligase [Terrilactibacillus laevilacticus]|uniref:Methionine--tRNA ligase n=1 Tax=Terrilactibacillus laevilacticus TaxID=1380157 RepID=A0ABW5PUF3_9BACI|nr:methionine--tRNA ligase [Terrilactibacillus laevilacticus]